MLSPLTFSPMSLTAQWTDSPLLPTTAVFNLPIAFDLPSPFPDAGRPDSDSPSIDHIYYPVLPLDSEGVYRSPKAAFQKQVAANKADPRWKHAGVGLGLGLSGTTKHAGVLQWSYVQSRRPQFLRAPEIEQPHQTRTTPSPSPLSSAAVDAPAGSLWNALTEFLDTTYALLSPPDSPTPETAIPSPETPTTPPTSEVVPTSPQIFAVASPIQVFALVPMDMAEPIPTSTSPFFSPSRSFSPLSSEWASSPFSLLPPPHHSTIDDIVPPSPQPSGILDGRAAAADTKPKSSFRVSFAPPPMPHDSSRTTPRPAWFAREETRAVSLARRFHIGRNTTSLDRLRARCAEVEARVAEDALRRAADEERVEAERDSYMATMKRGMRGWNDGEKVKLRFSMCGLPYPMIVRQQRRRGEGELARQAMRARWLKREAELVGVEWREWVEEEEEEVRH